MTTRSGPTISITKLWRAGLSSAFTLPRTSTRANTIQGVTTPLTVTANSASAGTTMPSWVSISSLRLSKRSASSPPYAPISNIGANCSAASSPTATPLLVRRRISHVSATIWTQLPLSDTTWPVKYRR